MHIVIAHSHLNPGGVTRIIDSQIKSLPNEDITLLVGHCEDPKPYEEAGVDIQISGLMNYLEKRKYEDKEVMVKLHQVYNSIRRRLTDKSILHIHNLNLGKNPIVTYAVYLLAKEGLRVVNHAHDFAEDRPANYQFLKEILNENFGQRVEEVLYPKIKRYHYAVLNSFDFERLQSYGIPKERITWLPNPVSLPGVIKTGSKQESKVQVCEQLGLDTGKILVSYPVRVIERKNIGELILLSLLFQDKVNFLVTQAPKNPEEVKKYQKWKQFCSEMDIPLVFEAGTKVDFESILHGSDFCISTSYKEGFGMVYLEPWLMNTPVVGRDIETITRDFKKDGFFFPALYSELLTAGSGKDFKDLSMEDQKKAIQHLKNDTSFKSVIFEQNPDLRSLFEKVPGEQIRQNIEIIQAKYSIQGYGNTLQEQYKKLVG